MTKVPTERRPFTVWSFKSLIGGEASMAVVAKHSEPDDLRVQHEYQRVLWQGLAFSKADAMVQYIRATGL